MTDVAAELGELLDKLQKSFAHERKEWSAKVEQAARSGLEIAKSEAWISEHDGWVRTAPVIEWGRAEKKLDAFIEALKEKP